MNIWMFQANPKSYNIEKKVSPRLLEHWAPIIHLDEMAKGDRVILWQSGPKGGVYAFGELAGKPYKAAAEVRVDIRYTNLLPQPVFKGELRKHPRLRDLAVLKMPRGKNPFPVLDYEWVALNELISKDTLNIFTYYRQEENRFTNGLVSLLELSRHSGTPLATSLLKTLPYFDLNEEITSFRVLRRIDGSADAELCGKDCCIRIETKIQSGTLREDQVSDHLERLERTSETLKVLVLLTPDDGKSDYIERFLSGKRITRFCRKGKHQMVLHLEWRHVYKFLKNSVAKNHAPVFNQLATQFLSQIHDCIFDQDFAGIIQKIAFGKRSGVDPDTYLDEIKGWPAWNTPREYKKLNGTGRKLLLYDKKKNAITAEVEIKRVEKTMKEPGFP